MTKISKKSQPSDMDQQLSEWRKQFNQEIPERVGLAFYTNDAGEVEIEVYLADESMWMSQQIMAELYGVDIRTINEHLINIFNAEELNSESTIRKIRIVRQEGKRQVNREIQFVSREKAHQKAIAEYEDFRIKQDQEYISDFEKLNSIKQKAGKKRKG